MECKTAQLLLEFGGPRNAELDAGEVAALDQHLADCSECARLAGTNRAADERLAAAMSAVPVPTGLRERLLSGLGPAAGGGTSSIWRGRWVAAAAVLLALSFGLFWRMHLPKALNVELLSYDVWEQTANPSAESVREWFRREAGLSVTPPEHLNYRLLTHYYLADLDGEKVPLLLFTRGSAQARVYILSNRQFNLKHLSAAGSSGCTVVVNGFDEGRGAYLILFTGDSLEPFLANENASAS